MYSRLQMATRFLRYYFTAANGNGHGVHSPFVFDFIQHVLNDRTVYAAYTAVEPLRKRLLKDETALTIADFGAGSFKSAEKTRTISTIARVSAKPTKYAQLIFRIARYYQHAQVLELGTSLGLTTAYLALANPVVTVYSLEGAPAVANQATLNFQKLDLNNIVQQIGNFDETLRPLLNKIKVVDLAFIDGNHRYIPTMEYFRQLLPFLRSDSVIIFDDIHWSREMERAWDGIKSDPAVTLSIDLFSIGLVFFRKDFKIKQHFIIRF